MNIIIVFVIILLLEKFLMEKKLLYVEAITCVIPKFKDNYTNTGGMLPSVNSLDEKRKVP